LAGSSDATSQRGLSRDRVEELLGAFKGKRILVVGDAMLDRYLWGRVSRISPEAPVPVVEVEGETLRLGGAANVAKNIASLGGDPVLAAVTGNDEAARKLKQGLNELGLETGALLEDGERSTTVKTRIIASQQQVVRADQETRREISEELRGRMVRAVSDLAPGCDAMIVSDYGKGVIGPALLERLLEVQRRVDLPVCVDPKEANFFLYRGVTLVTPNQKEASIAAGRTIASEKDLAEVGKDLLGRLGCRALLITRGEEGMSLFEPGGERTDFPTLARKVYDVTGAGDTVISVAALTIACGGGFREAAVMANHAAGLVIRELGAVSTTTPQILRSFEENGYGAGTSGR